MLRKIGVVGAGTMGHGIAEAFAIYGFDVNVYESFPEVRARAVASIRDELQLLADEGAVKSNGIDEIISRIAFYDDLEAAMSDRDYVIEAVPEKIELKKQLFASLDKICPPHTILASNTSSLKLSEMMKSVSDERKQRMIVNHWYNPAHIMPIAEMSFFGNMPEDIFESVRELYLSIGKQPVKVLQDIPGLIANRIQQAIAREVFSLIEMEAASPEDIDRALKFGPAFRYATTGQLEIADFGGLDIWCTVGDNLLQVMDNSKQANELVRRKVLDGKLGLKSGEGFYKYDEKEVSETKRKYFVKLIKQLKISENYIED